MPEIEIINETPLTLIETKSILEKVEKRDKTLSERAKRTLEYANKITKHTPQEVTVLKKKLEGLDVARLKLRHITKIIDIHPVDPDSLRAILIAESLTLNQEDLKKILECIK